LALGQPHPELGTELLHMIDAIAPPVDFPSTVQAKLGTGTR